MMTANNPLLITGNATRIDLPSSSIDMIITHPPYLGVDSARYGGDQKIQANYSKNKKAMLKIMLEATGEMVRLIKPSAHIFIANSSKDEFDLEYVLLVKKKFGLELVEKIVQNSYGYDDFGNAISEKQERVQVDEITTWYHFSNSKNFYYNPFQVKKYSNPVWNLTFNNMHSDVDLELSKKYFLKDAINSEIPKRFIEMFSKVGQTVLDPFGGSGVVAVTAATLGRNGISNDISLEQTKAAKDRVRLTLEK